MLPKYKKVAQNNQRTDNIPVVIVFTSLQHPFSAGNSFPFGYLQDKAKDLR